MEWQHYRWPWVTLTISLTSFHPMCVVGVDGGVQYCQWETFNASCASQPDHVILMTSARYGRMRFGRCMREDHGSVGCSADVMAHLDRRCSGRRTCQLSIPDATLHANHPCPKELMPYLEASYSCVKRKLLHSPSHFRSAQLLADSGYCAELIRSILHFLLEYLSISLSHCRVLVI